MLTIHALIEAVILPFLAENEKHGESFEPQAFSRPLGRRETRESVVDMVDRLKDGFLIRQELT